MIEYFISQCLVCKTFGTPLVSKACHNSDANTNGCEAFILISAFKKHQALDY